MILRGESPEGERNSEERLEQPEIWKGNGVVAWIPPRIGGKPIRGQGSDNPNEPWRVAGGCVEETGRER